MEKFKAKASEVINAGGMASPGRPVKGFRELRVKAIVTWMIGHKLWRSGSK